MADSVAIPADSQRMIMVVDRESASRRALAEAFGGLYAIDEVTDDPSVLCRIGAFPERYSAILLAVRTAEPESFDILAELARRGVTEAVPVFCVAEEILPEHAERAYALKVTDVIELPLIPHVALRRVASAIELFESRSKLSAQVRSQEAQLLEQSREIIRMNEGVISGLAAAIEFRSRESGEHVRRIRHITYLLLACTELGHGLDDFEMRRIALAAVLHDVGKIAIPDSVLAKPGRLTEEEFAVIRSHTTAGAQLLESIPQFRESDIFEYARDIALHHHERYDGGGYPEGLVGDETSLWAQTVAIADAYDALVCERVYKPAIPHDEAFAMIERGECGIFNPRVIEAFRTVRDRVRALY